MTDASPQANTRIMSSLDTTADPHPKSRDPGGLAAWGIAALVAATVLLGVLLPNRAPHGPVSPAEDAACAEWGDGCSVCRRQAAGPACSLPGIACTPGPLRCLQRVGG